MPAVAAIAGGYLATSFAAPAIVSAIGATGLSAAALTAAAGAVGGGLGSTLAGGEFGQGALIGGTLGATTAAAPFIGGTTAAGTGAAGTTAAGLTAPTAATGGTAAATGTGAGLATTATQALTNIATGLASDPSTLASLAVTVFGRPPQQLTEIEQQRLLELEELARTDRELFDIRVTEAQNMLRMADQQAPNVEQAFGESKIATERQLAEQTRGLDPMAAAFAQRQAGIRSSQVGATAAAAEEARGRAAQAQLTEAGLRSLPESTPEGYAGLALPVYQSLLDRQSSYYSDLAGSLGEGFGSLTPENERDENDLIIG